MPRAVQTNYDKMLGPEPSKSARLHYYRQDAQAGGKHIRLNDR